MAKRGPANPERSFGISVGTVLIVIAAYQLWRGSVLAAEILGGVGAVLLLLGLTRPMWLKWPSALWWKMALVLGYVNARILLTIIFAVILTPIALMWRMLGRDPLARRAEAWKGWTPHPPRYRERDHYRKMF